MLSQDFRNSNIILIFAIFTKHMPNFSFAIIAIILGVSLFRQFDYETLTFETPALAVVYLVAFALYIFFLVKGRKKNEGKTDA